MTKTPLLRTIALAVVATLTIAAYTGCQSSIPTPKGSSSGYSTAKMVHTSGTFQSDELEDSPVVNQMVQDAIAAQFKANGMSFGGANAELEVAYIIARQDTVMTVLNDDHFGAGRNSSEILKTAHKNGVIKKNPSYNYEAGAIIIDVLDSRTGKLIYRDFAKRDIEHNNDDTARKQKINEAVAQILAKFFN